jgi:hypothetical protein
MLKRLRRTLAAAGMAAVLGAAAAGGLPGSAVAAELSDKSVQTLLDYAWAVLPDKFTTPQGKVIAVDKKDKKSVEIPIDVAREVIKVARLSAFAQICKLADAQVANYRTMMKVEEAKKTWSDQQLLYISQLHLFTVMWLTGNVKIEEKDGEKSVVVDEGGEAKEQTCTDEEKKKVEAQIVAYFKANDKKE